MKKFTCFLAALLLAALLPVSASAAENPSMGASYTEIPDAIANPERGFYSTLYMAGKETGNTVQNPTGKLIHMRISLGNFSHNYLHYRGNTPEHYTEGGWEPLSQDFLDALDATMDNLRQNGGSAILRFAYDDFDGIANLEPDMEGIVAHIAQLSGFFADHADVIAAVESGFLGCWGEQHTSAIVTPENIAILADALLEAVPEPITVSVRRPVYYCYAAGLQLRDLETHRADPASPYYRLGVYNDGYLGSGSDLGTYTDRAMEVAWLDYQAGHTLFGGEVVANSSSDGTVYNSIDYISEEMFQTHTSYLNIEWNGSVIDQWRASTYTGDDPVYYGLSGFTYVENHLGYRFVLRSSEYDGQSVTVAVENVGAGNMVKPKTVTLNLVDETGSLTQVPTDLDVTDWQSGETTEVSIPLPSDLPAGTYAAYLNIADQNGNQIRFANDNPFNDYGNGIGSFTRSAQNINRAGSLYCWNLFLLNGGDYPAIDDFLDRLEITRVYQDLPQVYLEREETAAMVARLAADGIETVALTGDAAWGMAGDDQADIRAYIDALAAYNQGIGAAAPIEKIALDVEVYTQSVWKDDPQAAFAAYVSQMEALYQYAHSAGLEVVQVIPVFYDQIDGDLLAYFVEHCCDELSIMNYNKSTQISGIETEVALCRALGMKVETIFETMAYSESHGVTEEITYFYEGMEALQAKRQEILETYDYENLTTSYHHFPTVYHVDTGLYLAEIYAYTNREDPTRNDLGQTDALPCITLTGDDGSVTTAWLYNPNRDATYQETCYLAVGLSADVTYTIASGTADYVVTTPNKTFAFGDDSLVDYISIRVERVAEAHTHTPELRDARDASCTEAGYTGDTYCAVCGELLAAGTAIEKLPHTPELRDARDATCTEAGYTGDTYCAVCEELLTAGTAIEKLPHTPELRDARDATCAEAGYTGDTYCTVCEELLTSGTAIAALGHTGSWTANGDGTHRLVCDRCGAVMEQGACADGSQDGFCDTCGGAVSREQTFRKVTGFADGQTYLITINRKALSRDLSGTGVEMTETGGVYTASPAAEAAQLWTYENGTLWCQVDGTRYYLSAEDGELSVTTQSGSAAVWTFSNGRLSTQVSTRFLFWTYDRTYYLYAARSGFTLSILRATVTLYEAE